MGEMGEMGEVMGADRARGSREALPHGGQAQTTTQRNTHPIHSSSLIHASFDVGDTSTQSLPIFTPHPDTDFLHSCRHFFGLHLHGKERIRVRRAESG